jgi:hypothetical protein
MHSERSLKNINFSHALLITGLFVTLFAVMFRPAGAEATGPSTVDVYKSFDEDVPSSVAKNEVDSFEGEYNVILKGQTKSKPVTLKGVTLVDYLKSVGAKTEGVQFAIISFSDNRNSIASLYPLNQDQPLRPPMILSEGQRPGLGSFPTPSIVPGQPLTSSPIKESEFVPFAPSKSGISIRPALPGAKMMGVHVQRKHLKSGEYKLTAEVKSNGTKNPDKVQWYSADAQGKTIAKGVGTSIETTDAKTGSGVNTYFALVTESNTGSIGIGQTEYISHKTKKHKGKLNNPDPDPTPPTGSAGGGAPQGNFNGTQGGVQAAGVPQGGTTQGTVPPPTAATTQPTASTSSPNIDTTSITNAAQNVNGTGGLTTVSGVLLSAPTASPAGSSGGSSISALPAPVATELNNIFKPVQSAEDVWVYLLALLFAFSFSGAVREWVNP